ncbi:uncharacterized protein LOC117397817 [Acipenser ruthenus]|uniref:uncharacterized protein LOC117397817 n=1 Tax=Acipenser ruthenus TaxID=7906 RepID=UPI0027411BF2|nr:uncharacterized protein LOC117397817 [Acipenser ruthenus]
MSGHFNLSNNRSKFGIGANLSQNVPQDLTQQEFGSRGIHNDSTLFTWTEPPRGRGVTERGNGIVPGGIAAAVFIGLLLGLYAILWKCMVTAPKRKQTMRMRDQKGPRKDLLC